MRRSRRNTPLIWALAVLLAGTGGCMRSLRASLPRVEGEVAVEGRTDGAGLGAPVVIERDLRGNATVVAEDGYDAAFGHGFLHAQDRFTQMDYVRRSAAGELAEVFGAGALPRDGAMRPLRLREAARRILDEATAEQRRLLEAYAAGVNAALADRPKPPPEYVLLGVRPEAWTPEDSVLVLLYFAHELQFSRRFELRRWVLEQSAAPEVAAFLTPLARAYDAPMFPEPEGSVAALPPLPGPEVVDLRRPWANRGADRERAAWNGAGLPPEPVGSNAWAVAGSRTPDGRAVLANDPHLPLSLPNVWHRAALRIGGRTVAGVSAPGVPGIAIGASDHVAWGFTTPYLDYQDLVLVEPDPEDPSRYLGPEGAEAFEAVAETVPVRGGGDGGEDGEAMIRWLETRWGPVVFSDERGRRYALRWTALEPGMVNLGMLDPLVRPELLGDLDSAAEMFRRSRSIAQNVVLASDDGRVAYVLSGALPRRRGFDGRTPVSWRDGRAAWEGALDPEEVPSVVDPASGFVWTANNRVFDLATAERLGYWSIYGDPRALRIRELLEAGAGRSEASALAMQLDTRAVALDPWRDLALEAAEGAGRGDRALRRAGELARRWSGHAAADERGHALLGAFRDEVLRIYHRALLPEARAPGQALVTPDPVLRILAERPAHLLPHPHETWGDLLRAALLRAYERLEAEGGADRPWGAWNRLAVAHAAAAQAPRIFRRRLSLPRRPQAGDGDVLRVASPTFGASMRMVVSPGDWENAILHMPGGQSGHPLSRHFKDQHAAWAEGEPTPLLPGPARWTLRLTPGEAQAERSTHEGR